MPAEALPVAVYAFDVPDGRTELVVKRGFKVLDVWAIKTGQPGSDLDSVTVRDGDTAITGDMRLNVPYGAVVRAAMIRDSCQGVEPGSTLRVTSVGTATCCVFVLGVVGRA